MRSHTFLTGDYYHLYNRGVDRQCIYRNDDDRRRFLRGLQVFNGESGGDAYVRIVAYCLMDNHFHLLVKQLQDKGVSVFMQRFMNGYTKYFNIKYARKGRLFESVYQTVPVESDEQLLHVSRYIHLNPLKYIEPRWKIKIQNPLRCLLYLGSYRWSSYQNYLGRVPDVQVDLSTITSLLGNGYNYFTFLKEAVEKSPTPGVGTIAPRPQMPVRGTPLHRPMLVRR